MPGPTMQSSNRSMSSSTRQAGMTTVGFIVMIVIVGLVAFAGLRLTPVYLNYLKVNGVVNGVVKEFDSQNASLSEIRSSISRRFDVESVSEITAKQVTVKAVDGGFEVEAKYTHKAPFISNISFAVDFDKRSLIRR